MVAFILLLGALCLYKIDFANPKTNFDDYLSIEKTNSIKGIFILIVIFQHFNQYVEYSSFIDVQYLRFFNCIGQRMVTLFLFYSGYGIRESIAKKGSNYIKTIPTKRIGGVLFRFDTAVCLFLILDIILYGSAFPYSVKDVALSFVAWSSVGNSNWYIFAILFAYFFTFISYKVCNKNYELLNIAIIVVFCCVYIVIMHIIKESYWYNTILCYPLGMIWSLYKEKIRIIFQNIWIWIFGISLSFIIQSMSFIVQNIFITMISYIAFTILIVLLTMKVSINNKILAWCGKHLFGIFILQRIPMIILKEFGIYDINIYLSFIVSVVVTLLLSAIYDALIDKVWKRICKLNNL